MEKADAHARLEAPSPRVLVLDDDERLAEMVATALRLDGYQTVVACDGAQALELVRERPFDALLTDLLMPGLKGDDVAEQASRLRPDLRLLLMTASEGVGALSVPWSAVIRKPFSLDLVVRAVAAAIGDPHRAIQGDGRLGLEGRVAHAFWLREPGSGEIRPVCLPEPGPGDVLVRTVRSGISRGTEALVFRGAVPPGQRARMRAPFQEGDFPGPVKYGYLNVGAVEEGPAELRGRTVFCLYPHQTAYVVPAGAVSVVPEDVPPARAVLAGTVETAVNALWDAGPAVGDRVAVVGGGMVGCCVARLLCRFPAVRVTLVDVDPCRAEVARALGVDFALPADAPEDLDLVVHTSATSEGLQCALGLLAAEGTVIDLSWYGDTEVRLSLGGSFHDRRLTIRSSQVGALSPTRAARRTTADRLALALELLRDPAFDVLLTGESRFGELPEVMARLAAGSLPALCHTITYGAG